MVLRIPLDSPVLNAKQTILAGILPESSHPNLDEDSTTTEDITLSGQ